MGSSYSKKQIKQNDKESNNSLLNILNPSKIGNYNEGLLCDSCMENPIQTKLNCGHASLCYECMFTWTQVYNKDTCPICRTQITTIEVPYLLTYTI